MVLDEGVGEEVEKDLKTFMGREKWYADRSLTDAEIDMTCAAIEHIMQLAMS